MKTISAELENELNRPIVSQKSRVFYKRRYYDQATQAYVWENDWTEIPRDEVNGLVSVSTIVWQLDTEQLTEFKVSNVTVTVDNGGQYWSVGNRAGFFGPSASYPRGFEPYWTKFQVRAGVELSDGTVEEVAIFTGVATDFTTDSDSRKMQILVSGLESLLVNGDAERIGTMVTEENAGTGDGSTLTFDTAQPGVGRVTEVSIDGETQLEGADYSVSNTNSPTLPATIAFSVAPDVGEVIRISYFYWPLNRQFHEIIEDLLTEAGIASVDQMVDPVTFPNSVDNAHDYDLQADWDTGTKTRIDSTRPSGSIRHDFTDSFFREATTWQNSLSGWSGSTSFFSSGGSSITFTRGSGGFSDSDITIYRSQTRIDGQFEAKLQFTNTGTPTGHGGFLFMAADTIGATSYGVQLRQDGTLTLEENFTEIASASWTADFTQHTLKVVRYDNGRILVYLDGVLKIDFTDTTVQSSTYFHLIGGGFPNADPLVFDDIVIPSATVSAQWDSPTIDAGSAPSAWKPMGLELVQDGGSITIYTRTSTDGISWDAWIEISAALLPQSELKRYIQVRADLAMDPSDFGEVRLDFLSLRYTTSSVAVLLPNFTDKNIHEAIQSISQMANYEFGFNAQEQFFFRSKSVSASAVLSLDQTNGASAVVGLVNGHDRVVSEVRAAYGAFTREVKDPGGNPEGPLARYGRKRFAIDADSNIQIAPTADIASGIAAQYYAYLSRARRRWKLKTDFRPQIDLSDTLLVSFWDNLPDKEWQSGEPGIDSGDNELVTFGPEQQILCEVTAKVTAARYDPDKTICEFEMEEI